jgi:hypothetical protein
LERPTTAIVLERLRRSATGSGWGDEDIAKQL